MSTTFEDYGYTIADVQSAMSVNLHPVIVLIFCHGIHTCIFSIALYYIAQSTQPKRKQITLASIVTFLWAANTIIVALNWKFVDVMFITHGLSLEDEFNFAVGTVPAVILASEVFRVLNTTLADLILIWRCWVLYSGSLVVVAIPSLCLTTETISACIVIAVYTNPIANAHEVNWSLVYYSMTLVTNTLCTFLILFRIVRVSGVGVSLKTYRGIIEILVESAAMYAIIYMALVVAYAYEFYTEATVATATSYLTVLSYSITGIAPTLIILRVMAGHSRPDDSWTRPSLPHMRSTMRSIAESLRFASAPNQSTSTGHTTTNIDVEQAPKPEVSEEQRDGGDMRETTLGIITANVDLNARETQESGFAKGKRAGDGDGREAEASEYGKRTMVEAKA